MPKAFLLFVFLIFVSNVYSQQVITLKEVRVFPENYAIDIIAKMKIATKKNLSKDYSDFQLTVANIKDSKDTVTNIKQNGKFQLRALQNRNYKFADLEGKRFYDDAFFAKYEYTRLFKYWSFYGTLNRLFELDLHQFFKNFDDYKYQVSIKNNCYLVSFTSDKYSGEFKVDTLTFNLLNLNYSLIKPQRESGKGTKVGIPTYITEKLNTLNSVNEIDIIFIQDSFGKISLNSLESRVLWDEFEVFKYEENKANKLKYTDKFRIETFIQMKKISI